MLISPVVVKDELSTTQICVRGKKLKVWQQQKDFCIIPMEDFAIFFVNFLDISTCVSPEVQVVESVNSTGALIKHSSSVSVFGSDVALDHFKSYKKHKRQYSRRELRRPKPREISSLCWASFTPESHSVTEAAAVVRSQPSCTRSST